MCKHCVAALLAYVNRRQAKDILAAKRTGHEVGEQGSAAEEKPAAPMQTAERSRRFEPVFTACRRELSDSGERLWKGGTGALF